MAKIQKKKIIVKPKSKAKRPSGKKLVAKEPVTPIIPTKRLLARSEGLQVDFKRDAESVKPDDLVAFANSGGGTILIGVDEVNYRRQRRRLWDNAPGRRAVGLVND